MKQLKTLIFTFLITFSFIGEAYAKEAIEKCLTGSINWTQGVVYASGMGPVKQSLQGTAKGKIIARRIAIVDCQRNLLETTKGVRLTSTTTVRNAILESDVIKTTVYGLVKHAEVVSEKFEQDGVYRVKMKMPLAGKFLGAVLKKNMLFSKNELTKQWAMDMLPNFYSLFRKLGIQEAHAAEFSGDELKTLRKVLELMKEDGHEAGVKEIERLVNEFQKGAKYTGVLVDARAATGFKMAACPLIRTADGKTIYPGKFVTITEAKLQRPVSYDIDIADAIANKRIFSKPLVVNAKGIYKSKVSDLVVDDAGAKAIMALGKQTPVLRKCKVMIVVAE
jgi:hypothetical protein